MHSPLTAGHVARALERSVATIHRLDGLLTPIRDSIGRRLYDPARVAFAAGLAATRDRGRQ